MSPTPTTPSEETRKDKPTRSTASGIKKRTNSIINRRLIRNILRNKEGKPRAQKHAITNDAYKAVSHMGLKIMESLIARSKEELSKSTRPSSSPTRSISSNHVVHSANCLKIPPGLVGEAIDNASHKSYDTTACKASNVRRICQNHCGKTRVRKETVPVLWCIVARLVEELINQSVKSGEEKGRNIRIRPQTIYSAIKNNQKSSLSNFATFVGPGTCLGI